MPLIAGIGFTPSHAAKTIALDLKMKNEELSDAEKEEVQEAYYEALEAARRILIAIYNEDPKTQMAAARIASLALHQRYVSAHNLEEFISSAEEAWDYRDDIGFDLFGKPITTIMN